MKYPDPYEELSDEEFEDQFLRLLEKERSVAVSFRFPQSLLDRAKVAARNLEVPYQTLVKSIVEAGLERLERRSSAGAELRRRVQADSDLAAAATKSGRRRRTRATSSGRRGN